MWEKNGVNEIDITCKNEVTRNEANSKWNWRISISGNDGENLVLRKVFQRKCTNQEMKQLEKWSKNKHFEFNKISDCS